MAGPSYNIILDFDDVIYPFCQGILSVLAEEGITGEITQWRLEKDFGMESKEFWELLHQDKHAETLYMQPIPFRVLAALRRLRYAGHRLHLVTARTLPSAMYYCQQSLMKWKVPLDTVTFTHDKGPMVDKLDASFSLDDKPENWVDFNKAPNHHAVLMDACHNSKFVEYAGDPVPRVESLDQFANHVIALQAADVQVRAAEQQAA